MREITTTTTTTTMWNGPQELCPLETWARKPTLCETQMLEALLKIFFFSIQTSAYWPGLVQMLSQAAGILAGAKRLCVQGCLAILNPLSPPPPTHLLFQPSVFQGKSTNRLLFYLHMSLRNRPGIYYFSMTKKGTKAPRSEMNTSRSYSHFATQVRAKLRSLISWSCALSSCIQIFF